MITGVVDMVAKGRVSGWAFNSEAPDEHLTVIVKGRNGFQATGAADILRPDLIGKLGDGDHSFRIEVPPLFSFDDVSVTVVSDNGQELSLLSASEALRLDEERYAGLAQRVEGIESRLDAAEVFFVRLDEMMRKIIEAEKKKRKRWLGIF